MDKFLEKIELDIKSKILSCAKGQSIVKPFDKVFQEVREIAKKNDTKNTKKNEQSIYDEVIRDFLRQYPEFIKEEK